MEFSFNFERFLFIKYNINYEISVSRLYLANKANCLFLNVNTLCEMLQLSKINKIV